MVRYRPQQVLESTMNRADGSAALIALEHATRDFKRTIWKALCPAAR